MWVNTFHPTFWSTVNLSFLRHFVSSVQRCCSTPINWMKYIFVISDIRRKLITMRFISFTTLATGLQKHMQDPFCTFHAPPLSYANDIEIAHMLRSSKLKLVEDILSILLTTLIIARVEPQQDCVRSKKRENRYVKKSSINQLVLW